MGDAAVDIDPLQIYFTFSRIRPKFSCGRTVDETVSLIASGVISIHDIPRISVLFDGAHYYSLNNRRLYVFKALREMGVVHTVPVRLKAVPNTKRMKEKYSPKKCALSARLMPTEHHATAEEEGDGRDGSGAEETADLDSTDETLTPVPKHSGVVQASLLPQKQTAPKQQQQPRRSGPQVSSLADELAELALRGGANSKDDNSDDSSDDVAPRQAQSMRRKPKR